MIEVIVRQWKSMVMYPHDAVVDIYNAKNKSPQNIASVGVILSNKVREWFVYCEVNDYSVVLRECTVGLEVAFMFVNEKDALMFKMKWL